MSTNIAELIGNRIKKLREDFKISQSELASKMNMARPGISNWENGKSEPSSSQLVALSKIFKVSTDSIVGNYAEEKTVVVLDTSALIKRPLLLEDIELYFNEIIIPEVVISELNNLKDKGKPSTKQKAWLVMKTINDKKDSFQIISNIKEEGKNDEKIADIAIYRAKQNPNDAVYLLSNDIWFQFLTRKQKNLQSITPMQYVEQFQLIQKDYDSLKSTEFGLLAKNRKLDNIKAFDLKNVDINFNNPEDGFSPLIYAVRNRDIAMIEYLISLADIDLDHKDKYKYGFGAIHHASQIKNLEIIKILTDAGADIDLGSKGKNIGNTPLMISAWSGFLKGVEYFLSYGACTNQQDNNGYTALMKACIKHDFRITKMLIKFTDLNIRSRENKKAKEYINPRKDISMKIIKLFKEVEND